LGTRIHLAESGKKHFALGTQITLRLPIQGPAYKTDRIAPRVTLIASRKFTKKVSCTINAGIENNGIDNYIQGNYVLNGSYSITNKWNVFIENYGLFTKELQETRCDAGFAYYARPNLQIDAYAGYGLNKGRQDYFVSLGFSWRFLKWAKSGEEAIGE
jgi:hypothetical protein